MQTVTFYKYVPLKGLDHLSMMLKHVCDMNHLKGTILLSKEGINGAISGKGTDISKLKGYFRKTKEFSDLTYRTTTCNGHPFKKMKVKIRKEIVSLHSPKTSVHEKGGYVTPKELNELIRKKEVILFDARNDYETKIGKFKGAIDPNIKAFRDLATVIPRYKKLKKRKIVMYCTGGVRCEKASALFRERGFEDVSQLKGGIINYINKYPDQYFEGACFVFDNRLMIPSGKKKKNIVTCSFCRKPATIYRNCANVLCDELFLACKDCYGGMKGACSEGCRKKTEATHVQKS